jgi:enoyl-[acyl-carrier protein] reductase II
MKGTRVSELLGIDYPIIQGAMNWVANGELAAAVSEAGGLGIVTPGGGWDGQSDRADNLRRQLRIVREHTNKPFGVNVSARPRRAAACPKSSSRSGCRSSPLPPAIRRR